MAPHVVPASHYEVAKTLRLLEDKIRKLSREPTISRAQTTALVTDLYHANALIKKEKWSYFNICLPLNSIFLEAYIEKRAVQAEEVLRAVALYDNIKKSKMAVELTRRGRQQHPGERHEQQLGEPLVLERNPSQQNTRTWRLVRLGQNENLTFCTSSLKGEVTQKAPLDKSSVNLSMLENAPCLAAARGNLEGAPSTEINSSSKSLQANDSEKMSSTTATYPSSAARENWGSREHLSNPRETANHTAKAGTTGSMIAIYRQQATGRSSPVRSARGRNLAGSKRHRKQQNPDLVEASAPGNVQVQHPLRSAIGSSRTVQHDSRGIDYTVKWLNTQYETAPEQNEIFTRRSAAAFLREPRSQPFLSLGIPSITNESSDRSGEKRKHEGPIRLYDRKRSRLSPMSHPHISSEPGIALAPDRLSKEGNQCLRNASTGACVPRQTNCPVSQLDRLEKDLSEIKAVKETINHWAKESVQREQTMRSIVQDARSTVVALGELVVRQQRCVVSVLSEVVTLFKMMPSSGMHDYEGLDFQVHQMLCKSALLPQASQNQEGAGEVALQVEGRTMTHSDEEPGDGTSPTRGTTGGHGRRI